MGKENTHSILRYIVISTVVCLLFLCIKKDSITEWVRANRVARTQAERIERIEAENKALDERIENLTTNRDTLEKYAREVYGFCADSEDVYLVK